MSAIAGKVAPPDLLGRFTPTDHRHTFAAAGGRWTVQTNDPGIAAVVQMVAGQVSITGDLSFSLVKEKGNGCCAEVLVIADAKIAFVCKGESCVIAYDRALGRVMGFCTDDISDEVLAELVTTLLSAGTESMVVDR